METSGYPWLQVDMDEKANITLIQVRNSERNPASFRIYVRDDVASFGKACGNYHVFAGDETRIIRCKPMYGRSVKIVGKDMNDFLSLCEVQIFNNSGWCRCRCSVLFFFLNSRKLVPELIIRAILTFTFTIYYFVKL